MIRWLHNSIGNLLDRLDPPLNPQPVVPCPACNNDISKKHDYSVVRNELIYYRCICGVATAWYWNGHGPQLIYGHEPNDNPELDEDFD